MITYSWQSCYIREYKRLKVLNDKDQGTNVENIKIAAMNVFKMIENISFARRYKLQVSHFF